MKNVYYIITIILSALAMGLFLLISFPLSKESAAALLIAVMMGGFLLSSIMGLVKKSYIPGIMLVKAGLLLSGIGGFCIVAVIGSRDLSIPFIAVILLLMMLGVICILNGIRICKNRSEKAEADAEEKAAVIRDALNSFSIEDAGLSADPDAPVKKIWQYKLDGKPEFTQKQTAAKRTFLLLSCAGAFAGLVLPMILMFSFDIVLYDEPVGLLMFLLSFLSIFGFAITLAEFKGHHTENRAFVLGEDGSVFMINYFQPAIAHEFGYYDLLPQIVRSASGGKVAALRYPIEAARCLRYIREREIDKQIAEKRSLYGNQIRSVPEICKCSYYSAIHFTILADGQVQEYKNWYNLYDNCYEDYDEMIDYFATRFTHRYDEAYRKKTKGLRVMTGIGIILLCIGMLSFLGVLALEMQNLYLPGFLGLVVGLALLASGLDALRKRHAFIPGN